MFRKAPNLLIAARFIALALVINLAAPLSAGASAEKFLLCTAQGYQWVEVALESEPTAPQANNHCVFCLNSDEDAAALFADIANLNQELSAELSHAAERPIFAERLYFANSARAPPNTPS